MDLGVDVQRLMTPPRYQPGVGLRPGEPDHAAAALVPVFYAGLYESIAAHSKVGLDVVAGLGHYDATILADCARRLDGLPAVLVGVRCPLEVVMARRAAAPAGKYAVPERTARSLRRSSSGKNWCMSRASTTSRSTRPF
jgi:chloramphenicol 3-O phosphotransferase